MLYLDLPVGNQHGWGICGKYLTQALGDLVPVGLIQNEAVFARLDPLEAKAIARHLAPPEEYNLIQAGILSRLTGPLLSYVPYGFPTWGSNNWPPPQARGTFTVGYTFFEEHRFNPAYVEYMKRHFDCVIAGAEWGEAVLKQHGIENAGHVVQGIDHTVFHPVAQPEGKALLKDQFIIFSGGKFEFRKGQDLVIRAVKILQDKYPDVILMNAWVNHWKQSMASMRNSPFIRYNPKADQYQAILEETFRDNDVDLSRVITLPAYPNAMMARLYHNSDVGLFPNRCEGGTNLVLMEYMACGKPAIATYGSGHRDVVNPENALLLEDVSKKNIQIGEQVVAFWDEAKLDDMVAKLEWAYHHRDELSAIGRRAAQDMKRFSWQHAAEQFLQILQPHLDNTALSI